MYAYNNYEHFEMELNEKKVDFLNHWNISTAQKRILNQSYLKV